MKYWRIVLVFIPCLMGSVAQAAHERLQATFYPQPHLSIESEWQSKEFNSTTSNATMLVSQTASTELRLTIPESYVSSPDIFRIYLILPHNVEGIAGIGGFLVTWETQGRFLNGSAKPGDQALLYEGAIDNALLSDYIIFKFLIDASEMTGEVRFAPRYEIERK